MITDEMLTQVTDAYILSLAQQIPQEPEFCHVFSRQFHRKMRRVIRRGNHPLLYRTIGYARNIAAILILSFLMLMAFNPSARAAVMDWIREMYKDYYSHNYYIQGTDIELLNVHCELGYIPPSYVEFSHSETSSNVIHTFVNETGEMINISYSKQPNAIEYFYETNEFVISIVDINNQYGEFIETNNSEIAPILQWNDVNTDFLFSISGYLEKSEIIKIAENIKIELK